MGLLTLFEWYKYVEVGDALKSPQLAVWVVCSESHFSVLFSNDPQAVKVGGGLHGWMHGGMHGRMHATGVLSVPLFC